MKRTFIINIIKEKQKPKRFYSELIFLLYYYFVSLFILKYYYYYRFILTFSLTLKLRRQF